MAFQLIKVNGGVGQVSLKTINMGNAHLRVFFFLDEVIQCEK